VYAPFLEWPTRHLPDLHRFSAFQEEELSRHGRRVATRRDTGRKEAGMKPRKNLVIFGLSGLVGIAGMTFAAGPATVSPGSLEQFSVIADRCPSFSWGAVAGVERYELVITRVAEGPAGEASGIVEAPLLRREIPGAALSWTPALVECPASGGRYAWSVRAVGGRVADQDRAWSEARLFTIRTAPSVADVEQAMAVLRQYVAAGGELGAAVAGTIESEVPAALTAGAAGSLQAQDGEGAIPAAPTLPGTAAIRGEQSDPTGETYGVYGISESSTANSTGVVGENTAASGDVYGLVGIAASPSGAGVVAFNSSGGSDLMLVGTSETWAVLTEGDLDRSSASPTTFNFDNSGAGSMTLQVEGIEVVTVATDSDALGGLSCASGELAKWNDASWACDADLDTDTLAALSCAEGEIAKYSAQLGWYCSLDAGAVDTWVDETGDTMTGTLTLNPAAGNALETTADINIGGHVRKGGGLFIHTSNNWNTALGQETQTAITTGDWNTSAGFGALKSNTTGDFNTAIGIDALRDNVDGTRNTALGAVTMKYNVSGSRNTALGFDALRDNTSGDANSAVGYRALFLNSTGVRNNAFGSNVLSLNTTGHRNSALGNDALQGNQTGAMNTAIGDRALQSNTIGHRNTAVGGYALRNNTSGSNNTASGYQSLFLNTGFNNTAVGAYSLKQNSTGSHNTAVGEGALRNVSSGSYNTAVGYRAGLTTAGSSNILLNNSGGAENNTLRIGAATGTGARELERAFIAGIRGVTTGVDNAIPVLIDSNGQLGTTSSSRRFKEDIGPMGEVSQALLDLRPVTFRFKEPYADGGKPLQFGLIAEEVAEVFPELVVYDEEGRPETVKYHLLSTLLLNELQKLSHQAQKQHRTIAVLSRRLEQLEGGDDP
jgi:hypothetical protein